jgi:hypothetical protein
VIPTTTAVLSPPIAEGRFIFHAVIDSTGQSFSMDGSETNGLRLHHEVLTAARELQFRFWECELRAGTKEQALADMRKYFPNHKYLGTWADARRSA